MLVGHIYKNELKTEFENPFIWEMLSFESMFYMITNWNKINWNNYKLIKDKNWNFSVVIEDKIIINYVHYRFKENATTPIKIDMDIYYNKIWEYILEKFETRLNRMLKLNENPVFIFADRWDRNLTCLNKNQLSILNDLNKDNIIVAVDKIYPEYQNIKQIERNPIKNHHNDILAHEIFKFFLQNK